MSDVPGLRLAYPVQANSVFASFAPCDNPKYVVIVMIPNTGYGADYAAPTVRKIYDAIYGLEGHKADVPGGKLPSSQVAVKHHEIIKAVWNWKYADERNPLLARAALLLLAELLALLWDDDGM